MCWVLIRKDPLFLTHWGGVTHICVSELTIIASDNGLSPGRRQAIIWTNVGILLIGPLGTNFSEMLIEIHTFSFKKMHFKMSSGKCRPFCLCLNVLTFVVLNVCWAVWKHVIYQHWDGAGSWNLSLWQVRTWWSCIWVRSPNCVCLVTWFCYQLIAKPGNKTAAVSWPDPLFIIMVAHGLTMQGARQ